MEVKALTGQAAKDCIPDLARLRIEVFRDFPYLYEGSMDYEEKYLESFLRAPDSILVVAVEGQQVVGASTGMPLAHQPANIRDPWTLSGWDVSEIFYFGESVLERKYRGQGIGLQFFNVREKWALSLNRFRLITFCAVVRPATHPLKPKDYQPLDAFWGRRGYSKAGDLVCQISWQDTGEAVERPKTLQFWQKPIKAARRPV